jgi:hypothetical protein
MSFEQACKELNLQEDDLKRLVSDGEIRGFRDKGLTIFKKEDVRALKDALAQQPVIVPSEGEEGPAGGGDFEETVLNIEGLGEIDLGEEIGPAVEAQEKPAEGETFATIEDVSEDTRKGEPEKGMHDTIKMHDTAASEEEETFVLSESDLGNETESLELLDETSTAMGQAKAPAAGTQAAFVAPGMAYETVGPADKFTVTGLTLAIMAMALGIFVGLGFLLQRSNVIVDLLSPVK